MPWPSSSFGTRARPSEFAAGLPHARSSRRGPASRTKELTIQTAHLVPAAHFCVRGLHPCFTHPERGVGGAPRNVRVLGGTPVGRIMTRYARRLRGALRHMTQQYTGRNNVTISMLDSGSVPIVSQTEIEPMKTALSLRALRHRAQCRAAPRREAAGSGRLEPARPTSRAAHSARRRRVLRTPSRSRATARVRGDGLRRARTACEMDARGPSLRARFVFCVEGPQGASLRSGDFVLRISFWDYEKSRVTTAKC